MNDDDKRKSRIFGGFVAAASLGFLGFVFWRAWRDKRRAAFIRAYVWPEGLLDRLGAKRPGFGDADKSLVADALRQFFLAYSASGRKFVSMPSQAADDLWHEFILYTRAYEDFCDRAFGDFFHHTPAAVLSPQKRKSNEGLRRIWTACCRLEKINPAKPGRLPLLFDIDKRLALPDGFYYAPDCKSLHDSGISSTPYCCGDFSSAGVDGSTDGFESGGGGEGSGDGGSDSSGHSGCSGGCSGGCGGGGD